MRSSAKAIPALLTVTLMVLSSIGSGRATGAVEPTLLSSDEATRIATAFITNESATLSRWLGASPGLATVHFDLSDRPAAYVFSVFLGAEDRGYVTVSSQRLPNPVLEFSASAPARHKETRSAVRIAVQGLQQVIDESKPLYLGILGYFYRLGAGEPAQLIEMGSQRVVTVGPGSPANGQVVASPHGGQAGTSGIQSTSRRVLNGPGYLWYRGCAPTAVANVLGYWADRGYPTLVPGGSRGDYRTAADRLAELMGTDGQGWTQLPIAPDILAYTTEKGYSFQSAEIAGPTFAAFAAEIDGQRPAAVLLGSPLAFGDHVVTAFGYEAKADDPYHRYMIVHDPWGATTTAKDYTVLFDAGYGQNTMVTVVPPNPWLPRVYIPLVQSN